MNPLTLDTGGKSLLIGFNQDQYGLGNPAPAVLDVNARPLIVGDFNGVDGDAANGALGISVVLIPPDNEASKSYTAAKFQVLMTDQTQNINDVAGSSSGVYIFSAQNINRVVGNASALNLGATIENAYGYYSYLSNFGAITNAFGFWQNDLTGVATNPYFLWYDSPGVFRVKGDGVMAYYNPAFTKYTPGAANHERIVQQWNSNVAEYGTEAGGTGTQRALRLLGSSIEAKATGGGAYVPITASAFTTASEQGAFTASPYGTGAGQTGEMRFKELAANGVHHVGLKAPDALAGDLIFTLPSADAAGPLVSDGSKVLTALAGANGSIVIPGVATLTVVKGVITSIV
jgi:hypothetical protein